MWTPTTVLSGCASALGDAGEAFTVFAQGQTIHVVQSVLNTSRIPVVLTGGGGDALSVVFETELDSPGSVDDWTGTEDTLSRVAVPPGREAIAHVTWPADAFQGSSGVTYGIHVVPITVSALGVSRAVKVPLQGTVLVMPSVEAGTDAFRDQLASVCGP
ncbi:hypothetical protein Xcel_1364 [Xylanimonas cellulosilytica DSM 15894]|uniref:Uncharacterized protein n=2 Tax=Xylanimonas TaxID=186188 RepID=D1BRE0_XYLCX|nr:hypothetical protein Xcel_1364 [Xylanimonas cellulosilytica DSM 15894]